MSLVFSATDPDDPSSSLVTRVIVDDGSAQTTTAVTVSQDGPHTVTYWSEDPAGNIEPAQLVSFKIDSGAPALTATASPSTLWSPNNKPVPVTVSGRLSDSGSGMDTSSVRFDVTDSYGLVQPIGSFPVAADGTFSFTVLLQASRLGQDRDGREYVVTITAKDLAGNIATTTLRLTVAHDQG